MSWLRAWFDARAWRQPQNWPRAPRLLSLYAVQAGGCDGCAAEVAVLRDGGAYDLAPLGLRFVTTPHDAELLVVTGSITRASVPWLMRWWDEMPTPKGLVAIGDCAVSGGFSGENYATLSGIMAARLPGVTQCDMTLRGCPPPPDEILRGLLMLAAGKVVSA